MEEIWKDVEGYEGLYQVSNKGKIKSLGNNKSKKEKILKQNPCKGYYQITLSKNQKRRVYYVHRLVAQAFIPNPDNLPQVGHRDENNLKTGNECNNNVENLYWTTNKENCNEPNHLKKLSKATAGKNNPFYNQHHSEATRKRMSKPVICIETGIVYYGASEAERKTNVSNGDIISCCKGKRKTAGKYHWKYYNNKQVQ